MAIILFCENGHDLSTHDPIRLGPLRIQDVRQAFRDSQKPRQPFCTVCGMPTLDSCQRCQTKITCGPRPGYCRQCGKAFPWTETTLKAAREYTDELDISSDDNDTLKATFGELTTDTPRTQLAAHRFMKLMSKIGPTAGDVLTKIIVNVATEAAKKAMSGH